MITLKEITNRNVIQVCKLQVETFQTEFVAPNLYSLAEAYATRNEGNHALPLAAYDGDTLVGFVMIGKGTVGDENEPPLVRENYSLWRLMVDRNYQRRGYGVQILNAVLALVKTFPYGKADYLWTSYDPDNERAREIYLRFGFAETGETLDGETVAVYRL